LLERGEMRKVLFFAFGLSALYACLCQPLPAQAQQAQVEVKREILALYDSTQEGTDANRTRIHRYAELPLNHQGFVVDFRDIREGLPDLDRIEHYRAVLTWFSGPVSDPDSYLAWAARVTRKNIRYIILGDLGAAVGPSSIAAINELLRMAGLRHTGNYITSTALTRVAQRDERLMEFECKLDPDLPAFPEIAVATPATRAGLTLQTPRSEGGREAVPVAVGPKGGYAATNYEFCHPQSPLYQGRWLVNPFAFFRGALGADEFPVPDITTVSGRRIYFSLLTGEGWNRTTKVEPFSSSGTTAAAVVLHELIQRFDSLPVTLDLKEGELPKSGRSAREARQIVQDAASVPVVELAKSPFATPASQLDAVHPSISNLSPMTSHGARPMVNAALNHETIDSVADPFFQNGLASLAQAITNTETPRRLKPFNLTYPASVGEYPAPVKFLKHLMQEAANGAFAPVAGGQYAAIVQGFLSARIDRIGSRSWRISNRGALQTVRFDDAGSVLMKSSSGVLGQRRVGNSLYVALDEAVEPAIVAIGPRTQPAPDQLSFEDSRWLVTNFSNGNNAISFEASGYGKGEFSWSGALPGRYVITATRSGHELWRDNVEAGEDGWLRFAVSIEAIAPVKIDILHRPFE
jgi:hypothetical protein